MWSLNYPRLPSQHLIKTYAVLILISPLITVAATVLDKLLQPAKGAVLTPSPGDLLVFSQVSTASCWQGLHRDVHLPAALALLGSPTLNRSSQFVHCGFKWQVASGWSGNLRSSWPGMWCLSQGGFSTVSSVVLSRAVGGSLCFIKRSILDLKHTNISPNFLTDSYSIPIAIMF